ncbi:MAG: DUF1638 domain-containing protein [Bryobacterales bacterium]|nr:DUF1638 domain-containing protein [Bryobacterales bacterium]
MRILLIGCEVLTRELADAVANSPHPVDLRLMPKALHDLGPRAMRERLQQEIDQADPTRHDAVALGYALCGMGLAGLTARKMPLVAARAHDCIAMLLGSQEAHQKMLEDEPGTYFRSCGWVERANDMSPLALRQTGTGLTLAELIGKYGEDNGFYLYQEFTRYQQHYSRLVFIENGLEQGTGTKERASAEAAQKGWKFEAVPGELGFFRRLASGDWNAKEFLVLEPGETIEACLDEQVIRASVRTT